MKKTMGFLVTAVFLVSVAAAQEGPDKTDVKQIEKQIEAALAATDNWTAQESPDIAIIGDQIAQMRANVDLDMDLRFPPGLMFDWENFGDGEAFDDAYRAGMQAIDRHDYQAAIADMKRVVAAKSKHVDGALYWEAYAQFKLGRTKDALATVSELRKSYPQSSWLSDAKALELEARNQSGQPLAPESTDDEDLKLLALNGLMHSDPSRATPLIEKVVADASNTPKLRERALFVLARSTAPDARQTVARLAEGNANPDLQA